jgi:hypothetical protein
VSKRGSKFYSKWFQLLKMKSIIFSYWDHQDTIMVLFRNGVCANLGIRKFKLIWTNIKQDCLYINLTKSGWISFNFYLKNKATAGRFLFFLCIKTVLLEKFNQYLRTMLSGHIRRNEFFSMLIPPLDQIQQLTLVWFCRAEYLLRLVAQIETVQVQFCVWVVFACMIF